MASMASLGMAMLPGSTLPLRQVSSPKGLICMAVPKKRTSKMKKRIRRAVWMQKAAKSAEKALSLAKSVLTGRSNSFYYETEEPAPPKCTHSDWAITEEEMRELMKEDKEVVGRPETKLGRLLLLQLLSSFMSRMVSSLWRFIA